MLYVVQFQVRWLKHGFFSSYYIYQSIGLCVVLEKDTILFPPGKMVCLPIPGTNCAKFGSS